MAEVWMHLLTSINKAQTIFGRYSWAEYTYFFVVEIVTALDRANAEDAILPIPKLHTQEKKRKHGITRPSGDIEPEIHSDLTTARSIHKRGKQSAGCFLLFLGTA